MSNSATLSFREEAVIVTGGTKGLGKAIGLEFARLGATVYLTHRWGSVESREVEAEFAAVDAKAPIIVECDTSDAAAVEALMVQVKERNQPLRAMITNVAFSKIVEDMSDLKRSSFDLSIGYSAWPLIEHLKAAKRVLGSYPRYALGISSDGGSICHPGYELAGAAKAVLETMCRYLALRLRDEGVCVNAVRPGIFDTASSRATFGDQTVESVGKLYGGRTANPEKLARACVGLCSGLMDAVTGQVVVADEGMSLISPFALVKNLGPL